MDTGQAASGIPELHIAAHVHPAGSPLSTVRFNQDPSDDKDVRNAFAPVSIVVGARDRIVRFYNSGGTYARVNLDGLLRLRR